MRKVFRGIVFPLLLATSYYWLPFTAFANSERIVSFVTHIELQKNGSAFVQEEILYDFGEAQKHGIFRRIPLELNIPGIGKTTTIEISSVMVTDGMGNYRQADLTHRDAYDELKIGDPDVLVTGKQLYVIRYTLWNAIYELRDKSEFYWNATGNDWPVPIERARAEIVLPILVPTTTLSFSCYSGGFGNTRSCAKTEIFEVVPFQKTETEEAATSTILRYEDSGLGPREGLTAAVGFPKEIIAQDQTTNPVAQSKQIVFFEILLQFLVPLAVFGVMFRKWWRNGRDPKEGTVVPEYDVPNNLSPMRVGVLFDGSLAPRAVTAGIVSLAEKGYMKIERIEKKGLIFEDADYQLNKLKGPDASIELEERLLLDELFRDGKENVLLSSLAHKLTSVRNDISRVVFSEMTDDGYFVTDPNKARGTYVTAGLGLSFFGFFLGPWAIISGIIIALFGWFMGKRSEIGAETHRRLKGFKLYLEVAEAERIKFFNAPEMNPEIFERFLPFAMVFGVENEWAKKFENIYTEVHKTNWYSGGGAINASTMVKDMGKLSAMGAAALSAQSRGGASGGGGYSGGGGGGGGGGSW